MKADFNLDDNGDLRCHFQPTPEQLRALADLHEMPQWKIYREVLISAKNAHLNTVMPMTNSNQIMKQIGLATGINFAINQLPVIVAQEKLKREKAIAAAEKADKVKVRTPSHRESSSSL